MKFGPLIVALVISGCTQPSQSQQTRGADMAVPDIFDIEIGKVINIEGFSKIDNGSSLPYAWLLAPLPRDSAVAPSINYRLNIEKESLVVHSVLVSEAVLTYNCEPRISELKAALVSNGYVAFEGQSKAAAFMRFPYKKGEKIASFGCSAPDGVPFSELRMQITTEAEHEKFEKRMRSLSDRGHR